MRSSQFSLHGHSKEVVQDHALHVQAPCYVAPKMAVILGHNALGHSEIWVWSRSVIFSIAPGTILAKLSNSISVLFLTIIIEH